MTKNGSKQMIITLDTETGKVVSVVDDQGNKPTRVAPEELDKIYHSRDGLRYVGTILYAHSSPGCIYIRFGGEGYKICW